MGNKQSESDSAFKGIDSFQLQRISKSSNPKTLAFYIDETQFPESGLIAVGYEFVENYDKVKTKCFSFFKSPEKIIASAFISEKKNNSLASLYLALENKSLLILNGKLLTVIKEIYPNIILKDLSFGENIVKSNMNMNGFDKLFIDALFLIKEEELLIGFENGVVTRNLVVYEGDLMKNSVYNPIIFQIDEKSENRDLIYENFTLPGVAEINFSKKNQIVIVGYRNVFKNSFERVFNLEETQIFLFKIDGEKHLKLTGCKGSIFSTSILENRDIYITLTSENALFFWNFLNGQLLFRISLKNFAEKINSDLFFTKTYCKEFSKNLQNKPFKEIFTKIEDNNALINGDILFCGERAGNLLLSQIDFENAEKKINWSPLKILKSRQENEEQKSKILQSIQMSGLNIYHVVYLEKDDELYMIDNEAFVRVFKNILQSLISHKKK